MKKFRFFIATFFLPVFILISGCKKDENVKPEEIGSIPKIEVSISNGEVPFGGSTSIYYHILYGDVMTLNGEPILNAVDSLKLHNLTEDAIITLYAKNDIGETSKSYLIMVGNEVIIEKPIITISPDVTIVKGDTTVFSWNIIGGDSIWSNISAINSFSGSIAISPEENLIVIINSSNKGGVSSCSSIITVTEPIPPPIPNPFLDILRAGKWNMTKIGFSWEGVPYHEFEFLECSYDDYYLFGLEYLEVNLGNILCEGEVCSFFQVNYSIVDSTFFGLGNPRKILWAKEDSAFCWRTEGVGFDGNIQFVTEITQFFVRVE